MNMTQRLDKIGRFETTSLFFFKGLDLIGGNIQVAFFPGIRFKTCFEAEMAQEFPFFRQLFPDLRKEGGLVKALSNNNAVYFRTQPF